MNINQLEYFLTLARTLNFTKSAMLLHITQPALSRQINYLEQELGVKLFFRDKRSVKLTNSGKIFLTEAKKIIEHYNNGIIKAKHAEQGLIGNLKIGFLQEKINDFIPLVIQSFKNKYPNIEIVMSEYSQSGIIQALQQIDIDIAFTVSFSEPSFNHKTGNSELEWIVTSKHYQCAVFHQDHPLASNNCINMMDLIKEPFIILDPQEMAQGYNAVIQICHEHGFSPIVVAQSKYVSSLLLMVNCKIGITILPNTSKRLSPPKVHFRKINNIRHYVQNSIAWKKTNPNPCLRYFLDEIKLLLPNS